MRKIAINFQKKSATVETKTDKEKVEILETKKELIKQYLERNNELLLLPEHEELLVCKKIMPNSPRIKELESKSDPELGQISIARYERKGLNISFKNFQFNKKGVAYFL